MSNFKPCDCGSGPESIEIQRVWQRHGSNVNVVYCRNCGEVTPFVMPYVIHTREITERAIEAWNDRPTHS